MIKLFVAFSCLIFSLSTFSASPNSIPSDLKTIIKNAKVHLPSQKSNWHSVERAALEKDRVDGEFGPKLKARLGLGPITKATGNALASTTDNSEYGVAYLGSLDLTMPLYAWGRKSSLKEAAGHGVEVSKAKGQEAWLNSLYEIKEAYYGFLMAKSLLDFIDSQRKTLADILEGYKKKKRKKKDIYNLEVVLAQVDGKRAEVLAAKKNAEMGLAVRGGYPLGSKLNDEDLWLSPRKRSYKPLSDYQGLVVKSHPTFKMLNAGISAKAALAKNEDLSRYPVLAVLAKYDFASTDQREKQSSIFANDPYNRSDLVAGIGFEWDMQFSLHSVKRDQYLAEQKSLVAQKTMADAGLRALVEKAWNDLEAATNRLAAARKGHKTAKKLWSRSAMSWAAGLGDSKEVSSAFTTRAFAAKDYYESIFAYEMAWAALTKAVGVEVDPKLAAN